METLILGNRGQGAIEVIAASGLKEVPGITGSASDWIGTVPKQMILSDISEGEYIVFEHGPFDFETENQAVEAKIEEALKNFDWSKTGYELDTTPGRIFYFYHDTKRFWKYVRPVRKVKRQEVWKNRS